MAEKNPFHVVADLNARFTHGATVPMPLNTAETQPTPKPVDPAPVAAPTQIQPGRPKYPGEGT
jgi:hypothetical protein